MQAIERVREAIVYCIIGCVGAALDFTIYAFLTGFLSIHYQIANCISSSCGIVNNFILNYFFNFKVKGRMLSRLVSFYSIGVLGLMLSAFCLWVLIKKICMDAFLAKFLTMVFIAVVQFCLNKYITFRKCYG
jgi:putative flippase GtrA